MWMYLGEELIKTDRKLDEDEFLDLCPTTLENAFQWVLSGKISDVKTIIGIFWLNRLVHEFR